jgi:proteasome accessory factor C
VTVELVVPQERRWALDRFAESVTVLADDEESVSARGELLPPVEQRLGLVLLTCGPAAFVVEPRSLEDAGVELARRLLHHHRSDAG